MLFVMMSTNTEKKISCFRGWTCLDRLWFFCGRKLGQYADQELLKYLFQNKTPDFKIYYWSECITSRVSSKNKEKQAKRKNSVEKKRPNRRKKNGTKKQKTALPGVEPGLCARSSNSLTTAPRWHTWFEKFILSNFIKTIFLCYRRCLKLVELYLSSI